LTGSDPERRTSDSEGRTYCADVVLPSADDDWQSGDAGDQRRERLVCSTRSARPTVCGQLNL